MFAGNATQLMKALVKQLRFEEEGYKRYDYGFKGGQVKYAAKQDILIFN